MKTDRKLLELEAKETKPAAPLNVWQQAIDAELVSAHLGVAHNDATFEDAQKAIHELICWHIDVATTPRTNGGKVLFQAAPVVLPEPRVTQSAQAPATAIRERDKFEQSMAASYPNLSFERHSYQYDLNRFEQYKVQWLWEGWQARAALDASDHIEQPLEMVAASVELNSMTITAKAAVESAK